MLTQEASWLRSFGIKIAFLPHPYKKTETPPIVGVTTLVGVKR